MQTYLITGSNEEGRLKKFEELSDKNLPELKKSPDFFLLEIGEEKSIGIEEIRGLQKKLSLKPFQEKEKKALIMEAQNLTIEAQNSLLKTLEEPDADSFIYLSVPDISLLLPTIVSRCQIINLQGDNLSLTEEEENSLEEFINTVLSSNSGQRLKLLEKSEFLKERQMAIEWINKLTMVARKKMLEKYAGASEPKLPEIDYKNFFQLLSQAKRYLSANCNVRLVIENLVLKIA